MGQFQIACQTITWGEGQKERFPEVFSEIKAGGFAGVEIGFRHIRQIPPSDLKSMLDKQGLALVASHAGGNLLDTGQASSERAILDEIMDYLQAMGAGMLMYSGLRYESDDQFARDLDMLNNSAEKCLKNGIRLLYHNHDWEFFDNRRVINGLIANDCEALGFCPDIGWVMKGGMEIEELLDAIKPRIGALHFKDFATPGKGCDTVLLGDGVAPLKKAGEWAKKNLPGCWAIAEQDIASVPTSQVATNNAAFLKSIF